MKNKLLISIVILSCVFSFEGNAQQYKLASGFEQYMDYNNEPQGISHDLDGDAIKDLVTICNVDEYGLSVVVFLSSTYMIEQEYFWFPMAGDMYSFSYEDGVLNITSTFAGRMAIGLDLQYIRSLKNMRLIGYEESYLGDYENAGAYDKKVDLVKNTFTLNEFSGEVNLNVITLSDIEKYFEYLSQIGSDYLERISEETGSVSDEEIENEEFESDLIAHSSPNNLILKIFEIAQTGDFYVLSDFCDPQDQNDSEVNVICQIQFASEEEQSAFSAIFSNGKITGNVSYLSKTTASVPVNFGIENEINEHFQVVLRDGKWYLMGI